jgi:hypothetical protein
MVDNKTNQITELLKTPLPSAVLSGGAVRFPLIRTKSKLINDQIRYFRVRSDGKLEESSDCVEIGVDEEPPENEYEIYYVALKFTHRALAALEQKWGNTEKWNEALSSQTETTVIETIAIALNKEIEEITLGLIDGATQRYAAWMYAAWMAAAGMDPQMARTFLKRLDEMTSEQNEDVERKLSEAMNQMVTTINDSPGNNGSPPGSKLNVPSMSSGT